MGEIIGCLTTTGDFGFCGVYWWAVGIGFDSWTIEFCVWFGGIIIPSRLLKDLLDERDGIFVIDDGVCIWWLIIVCGITGGDSTGFFTESNDNDEDSCCVFIKWLSAGTSSSAIFDEGIRESEIDDACEIWWFWWLFTDNEGCSIFDDGLFADWDSSSM